MAGLHNRRDAALDPDTRHTLNAEIVKVTQEWTAFSDQLNTKCLEFNVGRKRQLAEKSSKYFFRKYNAIPGSSYMLYDRLGNKCETDQEILTECHNFYSSLYNKPHSPEDSPYAFLPDLDSAKLLSPTRSDTLREPVSIEEMYEALQGMQKGKAPGLDSLTVDFYKTF